MRKIQPTSNNGSIRIRWTVNSKCYSLSPGGLYDDSLAVSNAERLARQIEVDILSGNFDFTLNKYRPNVQLAHNQVQAPNNHKEVSIKFIWNLYKQAKESCLAPTTREHKWKLVDNALKTVTAKALTSPQVLDSELREKYKSGTLDNIWSELRTAYNWATESGLINATFNPFKKLKASLRLNKSRRSNASFTPSERDVIIEAFYSNRFVHSSSKYSHSHYAPFVEWQFFTGMRPEETIALLWGDIVGGEKVIVQRAYSRGHLKNTKTNTIRSFPLNEQTRAILERINKPDVNPKTLENCLIFVSHTGNRIHEQNLLRRYWKPIVEQLVVARDVKQYLPLYNCRHTWITLALKKGIPNNVVAAIAGTSEEMIRKNYVDSIALTEFSLPSL